MLTILLYLIVLFSAAIGSQHSHNEDELVKLQDSKFIKFAKDATEYPQNCAEAIQTEDKSGIYKIKIPNSGLEPFYVYCQLDPANGNAWTVIQRRVDNWIDFDRNWENYELGFGHLEGGYFIGLEKLYALTNAALNELWIDMEDFDGERRFAKYDSFIVGDKRQNYTLSSLGYYTGNAGDSLWYNAGEQFSTRDRGNMNEDCAKFFTGGWWYKYCTYCNLNGNYVQESTEATFGAGVTWNSWKGPFHVLKYAQMSIRPRLT